MARIFGGTVPHLLGDWHFHQPLPYRAIAQVTGGLLICAVLAAAGPDRAPVRPGARHAVAGILRAESADANWWCPSGVSQIAVLVKGQRADRKPGGTDMTGAAAQDRVTVCHPAED